MILQEQNNTYFIADIHLAEDRPQVTESFINFCASIAAEKGHLFILGDLFDAWLGDDMMGDMEKQALTAIMSITKSGGKTFFIAGNRDFLVGKDFFVCSGLQELGDTELIEIAGMKALLLHGDGLCILDTVHQQQRKLMRTAEWKKNILAKSAAERKQLRQEYFDDSYTHVQDTTEDLLQIPEEHIKELFAKNDLDMMIYGHIHEPQSKLISLQGRQKQVICLGDWGNQDSAWFGKIIGARAELFRIPLKSLLNETAPANAINDWAIKVI